MLLGHLGILRFLYQVSEHGQDDPGDFHLHWIAQYVCQYEDNVELVHLLGQERIECEHPQAEDQLVLNLEIDAAGQHAEQGGNAVHGHEGEPVLVDSEHHLQAAADRLDVLVVLNEKKNAS